MWVADVAHQTVVRLDPAARRAFLEDGSEHAYDIASLNVGSHIDTAIIPGAREHAIADMRVNTAGPMGRGRFAKIPKGVSFAELRSLLLSLGFVEGRSRAPGALARITAGI